MMTLLLNGHELQIDSVDALNAALSRSMELPEFELWISVADGPSMTMLRNRDHGWLMYMRCEGDSGFSSRGEADRAGIAAYTLSNGQEDEFPLSWCIELEQCFQAILYFFINDGEKPHWISWHEH